MRPVQRLQPRTPVQAMQTYRISRPAATHTRPATCEEVECPDFVGGYTVRLPRGDDRIALLREAAAGRVDGLKRSITYEYRERAEQVFVVSGPCLKATTQRAPIDRPEIYRVRGGDWRANLGLIRKHSRPEHWVEDMQENLDAVRRRIER